MNASCISEDIDHRRRRFFCTAAMGIAATAGAFSLLPEHSAAAGISQPSNQGNTAMATTESDAIRPFRVNIPEEQLVDLRRRLAATRWPDGKRSPMNRKACRSR